MKRLILIDVDRTLLDRNYNLTVAEDELREVVKRAARVGVQVGLNSDSALATLHDYARSWDMKGVIIAEKGGVVLIDNEIIGAVPQAENFLLLRNRFVNRMITASDANAYLTIVGNVNPICNNLPEYGLDHPYPKVAVLINGLRSRSFSCYVRARLIPESWSVSASMLLVVSRLLLEEALASGFEHSDLDIDINPSYGICILHHRATAKSLAISELYNRYNELEVFMIGDSITDYMNDPRVTQCAVANGSEEYKNTCSLVANKSYTSGVIELIDLIIK